MPLLANECFKPKIMPLLHRRGNCSLKKKKITVILATPINDYFYHEISECVQSRHTLQDNISSIFRRTRQTSRENTKDLEQGTFQEARGSGKIVATCNINEVWHAPDRAPITDWINTHCHTSQRSYLSAYFKIILSYLCHATT